MATITYYVEVYVSGGLAPVRRYPRTTDRAAAERLAERLREEVRRTASTHRVVLVADEPHTIG